MKATLLLLAATLESCVSFTVFHKSASSTALQSKESDLAQSAADPFHLVNLDIEHAQDCADHFGKCSVAELQEIKEGELFLLEARR